MASGVLPWDKEDREHLTGVERGIIRYFARYR